MEPSGRDPLSNYTLGRFPSAASLSRSPAWDHGRKPAAEVDDFVGAGSANGAAARLLLRSESGEQLIPLAAVHGDLDSERSHDGVLRRCCARRFGDSAAVAGRCPVVASFVQHWFKGLEFPRNKILTICETCRRGRRPHRAPGKRAPILWTGQSSSFSPNPTCFTASPIHQAQANESRSRVAGSRPVAPIPRRVRVFGLPPDFGCTPPCVT